MLRAGAQCEITEEMATVPKVSVLSDGTVLLDGGSAGHANAEDYGARPGRLPAAADVRAEMAARRTSEIRIRPT